MSLYTLHHNIRAPYDRTGCITGQENTAPCLEHKNINWRKYRTKLEQVFDVYAYFTIEKTKGFYDLKPHHREQSALGNTKIRLLIALSKISYWRTYHTKHRKVFGDV